MDFSNVKALAIGEPYDAELEYLEFTGSQAVPVPNTGDHFDIDLQITGGANQMVFGNGNATRNRKFGTDANGYYAAMGNTGSQSSPVLGSVRKTVTAYAPKNAGINITVDIDGIAYKGTTNRGSSWSNITIGGNSTLGFGSFKLYGLQGYKLVRVGTTGCLYDPDTGNLIYPSTGTLVCGPDTRVVQRQDVVKISTSDFPWVPGARRVEYLQGDCVHNWIDTGITQSAGLDVELTIAHTPTSGVYFGTTSYTVEDPDLPFNYWYYVIPYGTGTRLAARVTVSSTTNRYYNSSDPWTIETPHTIKFVPSARTVYVDGSAVITNTGVVTGYTGTQTYYLMQRNSLGTLTNTTEATCRLYGCKMWQNGTLVRDFVPIKVGTEGCLYDKVNGVVYHNPGEVPFVCGAEVAETVLWRKPVPYDSEVEYLESNGTQYIDTGVKCGSNYTVSTTVQLTDTTSNACFWSSRDVNPTANTLTLFMLSTGQGRFDYGATHSGNPFNYSSWGSKHEYKAVANKFYIDDTLIVTGTASTFTPNTNTFLLASQNVNSPYEMTNFAKGKLYGAKIIDGNGNLVRDFQPVRVGTTGYLFDRISWTLIGNAGTGTFGYGNDVPNSW